MNRTCIVLAPPLAFALAAALAWFTGAPAADSLTLENANVRGSRQRAAAGMNAADLSAVLLQFEDKILLYPTPPKENHDANGMEAALDSDDRDCGIGGGMSAVNYAIDWADESPEAMFAWLVHIGGSVSYTHLTLPTIYSV